MSSASNDVVGLVGVGAMGSPIAGRLLEMGRTLAVFDLDPEAMERAVARGAVAAESLHDLGDRAGTVLVSLPSPAAVHAVIAGTGGLISGAAVECVVDVSTTGAPTSARIAAALEASGRDIAFVDAPVSGGVSGAAEGRLAVMVSGSDHAVALAQGVLEQLGRVFRVGERPGMGQSMKLLNNYLSGTALAATSEAMVFGVKAGLDPATIIDVVNAGSGRNSATQDKFPRSVLPGTFDFGFAIGLLCKDLRLFADQAEELGVPLFAGSALRQLWQLACEQQGAEADFTEIVRPLERWAGVEVRAGRGA